MKKNSINIKNVIINILFVILLVLAICGTSFVLEDKSIINKNKDFFNQDEDFDVLFFGSSHSELFFNPMILWKQYGIVSYNFGNPEEGIPVSYWLMKNAIEIHKPKVIVFDVSMVNRGDEFSSESHMHNAMDPFPLSTAKIDAAYDLLDDTSERLSFLFKIGYNHSRWKEISKPKNIFVKGSLSYGEHTYGVSSLEQCQISTEIADMNENDRDIRYILKIVKLCRSNDIELVLTANPFICPMERQRDINFVEQLATQNNIDFINFIKMNNVVDYNIDLYDYEHVNQSGLNKMCNYWGSYLVENYELKDHRVEKEYHELWEKEYDSFKQLKYESMWWLTDNIEDILQMLHDKDYDVSIFIGAESQVYTQSKIFARLIHNIGREDITVSSPKELNSLDQWTLQYLDDSLGLKNYAVTFSGGEIIEERTGKSSELLISSQFENIDVNSEDVIIIVSDNETKDVKLVRKYTNSIEIGENIHVNIPQLYFKE